MLLEIFKDNEFLNDIYLNIVFLIYSQKRVKFVHIFLFSECFY